MRRPHRQNWRSGARGRVAGALVAAVATSCATSPFRGDTGIRAFAFDLWDVHCPSGLRVIVERTPGSPIAGVTTVVGVGSRHDPAGREGLAHLVEHLAFRGHGPDQPEVATRLGSLGATNNAHTAFDETTYYAFTAVGNLRALLTLEGERLADPLKGLDEATFAVERDVVRNELRQRNETHSFGFGFNGVEGVVFPSSHPYARPIVGTHDSLSAITLDDARQFVAAHYRPAEMTMVLAGDIDLAHADELVRRILPPALYGDPAHPRAVAAPGSRRPAALPPPEPPPAAPALRRLPAAISTPELWIAWTAPGGFGADRFVADMWATLVWNNFSRGRLDDPDIADVDLFAYPQSLATVFVCRVSLTTGAHPEKSREQVIASLPWVGGDEIYLEARFRHLKMWALHELAFSAESVSGRSQERAAYAHFTGSLGYYGETVASVQSITADQARDFAGQYLTPARARTILLWPLDDVVGGGGDAARARTPLGSRQPASRIHHEPLPAPTLAHLAAVKHLSTLRRITLPNGLETVIVPHPGAPVITASLGLHGGKAAAAPGVGLAAQHAIELNFEESPGDFGIGIRFHSTADLSTATASAGAANLPRALDMLLFALRSYDVEWPSDKFRATVLPFLRRQEDGPLVKFERSYRQAVFADHPYGRVPTPDQVANTRKAEIISWLERTLNPQNAVLVIAGDVTPADAELAARETFGSWRADGAAVPAPPPFPVAATTSAGTDSSLKAAAAFRITHRPGATQAVVRLGCLLPSGDARLDAVRDVSAEVIEDELQHRLRHRTGSTYGVNATATPFRGGGTVLELSGAIDNGKLPPALATLRRYWAKMARGRAAVLPDIELARGGLAAGRLLHHERSGAISAGVLRAWNLGWPLDASDRYADYLASVTVDEVNTTLAACARATAAAVLGDDALIRAALTAPPPVSPAAPAPPTPPAISPEPADDDDDESARP